MESAPPRPSTRVGIESNRRGDQVAARRERAVLSVRRLGAVVFLCGAGTLATEIAASRLLAPYFGSSTLVWANVIGLILVYLSIGYWLGGRIADRRPDPTLLGLLVLVAALCVAAIPFAAHPFLDAALHGFASISIGAVVGSFLAALALFAVPVTLLGMVSPFAIRLALTDVANAGTVSGRLYALSTIGSIAGTFVSAIVAVEAFGTQRTMVGTAVLLAVAATLVLGRAAVAAPVLVAALLIVPAGAVKAGADRLYETESPYQYVSVVRLADGARALELNEGVARQSLWYPHTVLTGGYWDLFLLLPPLLSRPPERMLVIGNAGGTIPRAYGRFYPEVAIDGVELDPTVTAAGERYLGLRENPRLRVVTADGRPYLATTGRAYDLIVVDAYRQPYVPFYLATEEFFGLVRDHLRTGGMVALNVAKVPRDHRLSDAIGTTLLAVFPQAWRLPLLRFNDVVIAVDRPTARAELARRVGRVRDPLRPLVPLFRSRLTRVRPTGPTLTDDRAPVEWLTDRMLVEQIRRGEGLDEQLLPTAP